MSTLHRTDTGKQRTHHPGLVGAVISLAGNGWLRAAWRLHGRTGRTGLGLGALDDRAANYGARWALANLTGLVTCRDTGRARGNRGLQDILRHIGGRRALALEHILGHVWQWWAWRHGGLQDIFRPIDLRTLTLIRTATWAIWTATSHRRAPARQTGALCDVDEAFTDTGTERNHITDD